MKLSELNEQQLQDRTLFVKRVQETSDWELDTGTEELLSNDISVSPEALAKVRHGEFITQTALSFKEGMLIFQIVRSTTGENFSHLYLYYEELAPLLELLLAEAPKIMPEDYPDMVSQLMPLCKMVVMVGKTSFIEYPDREAFKHIVSTNRKMDKHGVDNHWFPGFY